MASKKEDQPKISFSLLENGLDFVLSAVEQLSGTPSKRQIKYAVLHLYSGILLILKERLRLEDWTLLFSNPDKADKKVYQTGDFHGPNLEQCIERLESIDVEISEHRRRQLGLLSSKRKRFEHFRITDSVEAITALTADALNFLVDFIAAELVIEQLDEEHTKILDKIRSKLGEFDAFVYFRWKTIESEVKGADTLVACPTCLEEAWVIEDCVICKFCGYTVEDSLSAAEEYITRVLGKDYHETLKDGG